MTRIYETANAMPTADVEAPGFVIESVRVVRRHDRYTFGALNGLTIGQSIDESIGIALQEGDELQDIAVHFEQADWVAMRDNFFAKRNRS